jgi:hypothetical protein
MLIPIGSDGTGRITRAEFALFEPDSESGDAGGR